MLFKSGSYWWYLFTYLLTYLGVLEVELGVMCMLSMGFLIKLHFQPPKCKILITKATWWKCRAFSLQKSFHFSVALTFLRMKPHRKTSSTIFGIQNIKSLRCKAYQMYATWTHQKQQCHLQSLCCAYETYAIWSHRNANVISKVCAGKLSNWVTPRAHSPENVTMS